MDEQQVETDGGRDNLHNGSHRSTVYYWLDPRTGAALYHTGVYNDEANPFFETVGDAELFLEQQADASERYETLSLYRARTKKVRDAKDVLTDQAGIDDFAPDGGRPDEPKNPERVWFWYNPSLGSIVQEEVGPYDVRGVFRSEDDADALVEWYAEEYGVVDTSHLELYSADLSLEGYGKKFLEKNTNPSGSERVQAEFDTFRQKDKQE